MLVEVSLKSFQLLAQLSSAKIVEHYDDATPVIELGDNKRYYCPINNSIIYSSYNSRF